jgi:hypothetical protein
MKYSTYQALLGSIDKWEKIVLGTIADKGHKNCPLCKKFNNDLSSPDRPACEGCPIFEDTGKKHCTGTPYDRWERDSIRSEDKNGLVHQGLPGALEAAYDMLEYLRDLKPSRAPKKPVAKPVAKKAVKKNGKLSQKKAA